MVVSLIHRFFQLASKVRHSDKENVFSGHTGGSAKGGSAEIVAFNAMGLRFCLNQRFRRNKLGIRLTDAKVRPAGGVSRLSARNKTKTKEFCLWRYTTCICKSSLTAREICRCRRLVLLAVAPAYHGVFRHFSSLRLKASMRGTSGNFTLIGVRICLGSLRESKKFRCKLLKHIRAAFLIRVINTYTAYTVHPTKRPIFCAQGR
jgi:hypothetical protein